MYSTSFSHGIFNYNNISKLEIFFFYTVAYYSGRNSGQRHSYSSSTPLTLLSQISASIPIENGNSVALYRCDHMHGFPYDQFKGFLTLNLWFE